MLKNAKTTLEDLMDLSVTLCVSSNRFLSLKDMPLIDTYIVTSLFFSSGHPYHIIEDFPHMAASELFFRFQQVFMDH